MANALVEQLRRAQPAKTAGRSDAELTEFIASSLEARGDLAGYQQQYPDFNNDLLNLRNAGGDLMRETGAALKAGLLDRLPATLQGFGALTADALAQEQLIQDLGIEAPLRSAAADLRGMARANEDEAAERVREAGGRTIRRIEDVRPLSPRDYLLYGLPTFAENAPSMAGSLLAGGAAAIASRGALMPSLLAAGGAGYVQNAGDVYIDLVGKGADLDVAGSTAATAAIPMALLDVASELLPLAKGLKVFGKVPESAILTKLADVAGRGGLAGAGKGAVTAAISEGATESLQELIQIAAEEHATGTSVPDDEVASRLRNAAAGGAIVGGPIGGAFGSLPTRKVEASTPVAPVQPAAPPATTVPNIIGQPLDTDWTAFSPESQTLGIPRAEMPQISGDVRGALANFLNARGIRRSEEDVMPGDLKPTQAEFSPAKVEAARGYTGNERAILVSADNHILDGHHQWVRNLTDRPGETMPIVRLDAPIAELLPAIAEFPSAKKSNESETAATPAPTKPSQPGTPPATTLPSDFAIADMAPARIARTTSNDIEGDQGRGGMYAIALERDGRVEVRNIYERQDGSRVVENASDLVPEIRVKGTGRSLASMERAGWTAVRAPFQLAARRPNLKASLTRADFDTFVGETEALQNQISQAINEGRGDLVVQAALQRTDPAAWEAVQFLRDWVAANIGAAPSHVLIGLGTRVDSVAQRDSLRTAAAARKLAAGDILRKKDGKVFGLFTDEQWETFQRKVAEGKGDIALVDDHFGSYNAAIKWGQAIAELGMTEQAGSDAFAAKQAGAASTNESIDASPSVVDDLAASNAAAAENLADDRPSAGKELEAVRAAGVSDATLARLSAMPEVTEDDVSAALSSDRDFIASVRRNGTQLPQLRAIIESILSILESSRTGRPDLERRSGVTGQAGDQAGLRRSLPAESRRLEGAGYRASAQRVARAWADVAGILTDAGIDVRAVQAGIGEATGGATPAAFENRRFVELVLKDLVAPTSTDLEVAVHEAVHVLFAAQSPELREALHRAIARLPEPDPSLNLSLQEPDPAVRAEEKLAVLLQGRGMDAGQAQGFASRLIRFVKDLYLRAARAVSLALGLRDTADAFTLRYFVNRFNGLLQGDYAPLSIVNALGGRPLTWTERAVLLPGIGRTLGRVLNGQMHWAPKVPDSAEALAFNLDLAFSRPTPTESEVNLRKGVDAVNRILADKTLVVRGAMFRPEVGSITFEWGNPGNPAKAFRGGYGIGHILARRSVVDGMDPAAVIGSLVETVAYGDASAPYGGEGDTRVRIDDGNNSVILSLARNGKRETWVITTFDNTRGQTQGSLVKNNASATGAASKDVPSSAATQAPRAFSPEDLVAVTDKLKLEPRLRVVKAGGMVYSRPLQAPMGITEPSVAINRDVATLNHMIATEAQAVGAVAAHPAIRAIVGAFAQANRNFADWFRAQFRFEDPVALKGTALARLDPTTQQPVQGVNPNQDFASFADASNSGPAIIHAHVAARKRLQAMSARLTQDREALGRAKNRLGRVQKDFLDAHRDYLNAEGLTALVLKGVRQLLARERRVGLRTGQQLGMVMQQLRELDGRSAELVDREYGEVFKKLFRGGELRGRNLFDLLDHLVNEARIDFHGLKITEIRQKISERVAGGMATPELGMLVDSSPSSRALLATVVAYAKTNQTVLAQIERRRLKNIAERLALQDRLDQLVAERAITNQAVTDLPRTAKLEERARILYVQEKRRARAMQAEVTAIEQRMAAAEAALPIYRAAIEGLERQLGGVRPDYTFGDGMTYRVPTANGFTAKSLRLDSAGTITDRASLEQDLATMTEWLAMKENLGELDADYRDVSAARQALLEGGYWEADLRKTDAWVRGNLFMPVGQQAEATGLPSGRIVGQMINTFAATEAELRNAGQRMGDRNNRLRDAAIAALNRGLSDRAMTADRYYAEIAEPAMSILEKASDLLELGLSRDVALSRAYTRIINHLLSNPATEGFVRGKEAEVTRALRAHLDSVAEASKFYSDTNARHGLGVRDERLITDRGDGVETAGIRDSLPVGLQTFSRRGSALVNRVYRRMRAAGWGGFRDAMKDAAALYAQDPNALRQRLAPYFSDPAIASDFLGAMAETDTYSPFDAPVLPDGVTRPEADPSRAAVAWRSAGGDVVSFIEQMHALHNGATPVPQYVEDMMGRMADTFGQLSEMLEASETGMTPNGLTGLASNLMIDARVLDRWPTAWSEHLFFDPQTNHQLGRRVAAQVAFGRDTERLASVWATMEKEVAAAAAGHEQILERGRRLGLKGKALRKFAEDDYVARLGAAPGKKEYARIDALAKLQPTIRKARENIRLFFSSKHNQLDATRFAAQLGQTVAFGMLNNPGTALLNLADLFSPLLQSGVSGATLRQVARNWKHLGEGFAGSVAQAFGLDLMKSSRLQNLYVDMGLNDPAVALQYLAKTEDGWRSDLASDTAPRGGEESAGVRALRTFTRSVAFGVTPLGEKSRFTALRPAAPFSQLVQETMRAATLSTWQRVEDMVGQGVEYFANNPHDLADPSFKMTADSLGMKGIEAQTFEVFRRRLAEGYGIDLAAMAREAMAQGRSPTQPNQLLSRETRALLQGMVASELILEGNLATMTPKAWTSSLARFVLPMWGWPIRRAMQVARLHLDPEDKFRMVALARGVTALGVMAGAGLAMALLTEEYHEEVLGRKRNLRSVSGLAGELGRGQFGEAFMTVLENVNRAGTFGVWGELLNTGINSTTGGGDNRTLSFDQRVVMMNSMLSLGRAISTAAAQGEVDYAGVMRPTLMALGGNSALQYLQLGNRALDLDNAEARFVERVDAQNRLRVAGRELGLEVRTGGAGGLAQPTPLTPHVTRMVLAAYAGDRADFITAWRGAVAEARAMGKEDPVAYVRDSFSSRHPLRNVFRTVSGDDYIRVLRHLDDDGRREVRSAVDRFNAYAQSLDAKAFVGTTRRKGSGSALPKLDSGAVRLRALGL